jgi:hypothetical protein
MTLPKETTRILTQLTGEERSDAALVLLMRDYARYKLAEIDAALERYETKYGVPFEAYKELWETEDREEHYTYEAEQDYLEWEALVTRRKRLEESMPVSFDTFLTTVENLLADPSGKTTRR